MLFLKDDKCFPNNMKFLYVGFTVVFEESCFSCFVNAKLT
jgi:hypothetical protein